MTIIGELTLHNFKIYHKGTEIKWIRLENSQIDPQQYSQPIFLVRHDGSPMGERQSFEQAVL